MSSVTKSTYKSNRDSDITSNGANLITGAILNSAMDELADSLQFQKDTATALGTNPSTWNVGSYDRVNATATISSSIALTMSNTIDGGVYKILVTSTSTASKSVTLAHSGLTVSYQGGGPATEIFRDCILTIVRVGTVLHCYSNTEYIQEAVSVSGASPRELDLNYARETFASASEMTVDTTVNLVNERFYGKFQLAVFSGAGINLKFTSDSGKTIRYPDGTSSTTGSVALPAGVVHVITGVIIATNIYIYSNVI